MQKVSKSRRISKKCPITGRIVTLNLTGGVPIWKSTRTCFQGELPDNFYHTVGIKTPKGYIVKIHSGYPKVPYVYMFVSPEFSFFRLSNELKFNQIRDNGGEIVLFHNTAKVKGFNLPVIGVNPFSKESIFECKIVPYEKCPQSYDRLLVTEAEGSELFPFVTHFEVRVPKLDKGCTHNGLPDPNSTTGYISIFVDDTLYVLEDLEVNILPSKVRSEFILMEQNLWL